MHQAMASTLEPLRAGHPQDPGRGAAHGKRAAALAHDVLRSPKGWTAPREVDGHYLEVLARAPDPARRTLPPNPRI